MIAAPPSEVGGRQDRVTWPLPGVAVRTTGTPGPAGVVTILAAVPWPASMAGQPASTASTAARHVPASVVSHVAPGPAVRPRRPGRARRVAGCPGMAAGQRLLARR